MMDSCYIHISYTKISWPMYHYYNYEWPISLLHWIICYYNQLIVEHLFPQFWQFLDKNSQLLKKKIHPPGDIIMFY